MSTITDLAGGMDVVVDGRTTTVSIIMDRTGHRGEGVARCKPGDAFDPKIGIDIALGRALVQLGERIEANAEALVVTQDQAARVLDAVLEAVS